jgi:hypothetical protein
MTVAAVNQFRVEEDALGNVQVPAEHLWGAQTQRSHMNFPIGVERFRWGRPSFEPLAFLKNVRPWPTGNRAIAQETGQPFVDRNKESKHHPSGHENWPIS